MTYIVVSENEIVKAEMERPECWFSPGHSDCLKCNTFGNSLNSLPRIAAPGHKWKLWDEVVEGKDFTWKYEFLSGRPPMHSTVWLECSKEEWGKIKPRYKRTIAIPIQNKIVKEDMICPETGKYCDDECCTVGSICNVSGSTDGISPQPTPEGEKVEERSNIVDYLTKRITELKRIDASFCNVRWDMSKHKMERDLARDMSNETTARRHELEDLLNLLNNDNTQTS